jgi:hypothetical protein
LIEGSKDTHLVHPSLLGSQAGAREPLFPQADGRMAHVRIDDVVIRAVATKDVDASEIGE